MSTPRSTVSDLSLVWAMSENRVIGRDGGLPWHLPRDLKRFKDLTLGHPIIMGRRTHDSLPAPLPKRRTLVLSRDPELLASGEEVGVEVVANLEDALERAAQPHSPVRGTAIDESQIFIVGGSAVYREALPRAEILYATVVHARVDGDTFFPPVDEAAWRLVEEERFEADERHAYPFSFRTYRRS